ncbi:hypothetical protein Tco_0122219 [Tanacetum coccineum]
MSVCRGVSEASVRVHSQRCKETAKLVKAFPEILTEILQVSEINKAWDARDALVTFWIATLKDLVVMSADSAMTYTSVHSEARSWSIPSKDPYEEAAQQAPHSPEYIPDPMELEDHVPVYIPEPEHSEDLVPAEDEAPIPLLPPSFLSPTYSTS